MGILAAIITAAVLLVLGAPWWAALVIGVLVLAFYDN